MKLNVTFLGVLVAVLVLGGVYWLGSYITTAQMGAPSAAQTTDPMARMATAMEQMAIAMEGMGGMGSGSMMGGSGMMGQSGQMGSVMQDMQSMMEQMHDQMGQMTQPQAAPPQGSLTEAALTRTTMGASIQVDSAFLNPLLKPEETAGRLVFKIALDTHSGDLMQYDLTKLAVLRTSEGVSIDKNFTWEPQSESSHHRLGLLKVDATAQGKPVIALGTNYIELELKDIGVPSRLFQWEESFLGKTKP